jgi:preprotein translocase subunit SecA
VLGGAAVVEGAYPERLDEQLSTLDEWGERVGRALTRRWRSRARGWADLPEHVEAASSSLSGATPEALREAADALRVELRREGFSHRAVARSFALVREAADRALGLRHFDVQLAGGWVMLHGMVAEMETGEGKTLTATLPACTAALAGIPVHVVTVNDYLAERDARALRPIYELLGLTVGTVLAEMDPSTRSAAYRADVTYCTNKQVVFDYLWDRITLDGARSRLKLKLERVAGGGQRREKLIHRGLHFAIVDEADSVLVDEARTPLIISEPGNDKLEQRLYRDAVELARELERGEHFRIEDRENEAELLDAGKERLAERAEPLGGIWTAPRRRESLVAQALVALHCYARDQHYLVQDERIEIIDEYTGRRMPDRSWEHGLHQMIEVKEGVPLTGRLDPRARISYQRFFRRYLRLAGMTGTAQEVSGELASVYGLSVVRIPTNRPSRRSSHGERVFATADEKWNAVVDRVASLYEQERAVLIGTRSVAASEEISARLEAAGLPHQVLNARQDREEAEVVAAAGEPGRITVATNMAGRGTDIPLSERVRERGGLYVIATERHEARRIDRQLFGRCARQGDPGSIESFISLEDELFETFADPVSQRIARRAMKGALPFRERLLGLALHRCQRAAEKLHARARRALLKRDTRLESLLAFSGRRE